MYSFEATGLWERTLARRDESERAERARTKLREGFLQFRERAAILADEIPQDFRLLTVHDISHIDALWEVADLIIGDDFEINPVEAFILGGAFLLHDLGMSLSAYNEGLEKLKQREDWRDIVIAIFRKRFERMPKPAEIEKLDEEIEKEAKEQLLRHLHAKHAEFLATCAFRHRSTDPSYYLLDDIDLRQALGTLIGQVAYSHWWPIEKVAERFNRRVGSPVFCPREWRIDPLMLACLIRSADACHLDARRAPGFLRALRKPTGISEEHWIFQEHLQKPAIENERIIFSTSQPFSPDESNAWWLCYDSLRMADRELRDVDSLLRETGRRPFKAKGIWGSDDPVRLRKHIPTEGWEPLDVRIKVTDVASLIQKLGGEELYGYDQTVPLRELIQNAADAVRARRLIEKRDAGWGEIAIDLYKNLRDKTLITVTDNGIGMSREVLCGPFLDFGTCYWGSSLMIQEHPGLMDRGFSSTGKYGIGFYSVFMWGNRVEVISRSRNCGPSDTLVLEFKKGLQERPIIRYAEQSEQLADSGTIVRIWFDQNATVHDGLYGAHTLSGYIQDLGVLCAWLCPASDVDIYVSENRQQRERVIEANDWKTIPGDLLLQRILGENLSENLVLLKICRKIGQFIRTLTDIDGNVIGRLALAVEKEITYQHGSPNIYNRQIGTITAGPFRSSPLNEVAGIAMGKSKAASRQRAFSLIPANSLGQWASEQANIVEKLDLPLEKKAAFANLIRGLGGETYKLPIAISAEGWLSFQDIAGKKDWPEEILIIQDAEWVLEKLDNPELELLPNVLATAVGREKDADKLDIGETIHSEKAKHEKWPQLSRINRGAVIESLARAWGVNIQDILDSSDFNIKNQPYARKSTGELFYGTDSIADLIRKPQ